MDSSLDQYILNTACGDWPVIMNLAQGIMVLNFFNFFCAISRICNH